MSNQTPKIAVVILNYNGREWLKKFLPSVIEHTPTELAKIWVADNASTDGSLEMIKTEFQSVNTISLSENFGFAEGYNQAIKNISCHYVLLLNSDVEVTSNWLQPLFQLINRDRSIAICQPKLLDYNQKEKFEYAGAAGGMIDKYGYPFCRGRIFENIETDSGQFDDEIEIFWATGACMLVRRDLFILAGGFDKDFFAHMEEIDLCWRIKKLGYKIIYTHKSRVYHVGGGTLNSQNPHKTFLNFRNNRLLLFKNLEFKQFIFINAVRNILDIVAIFISLLKFNFREVWAIIRAQWAYRKMIGNAFEKKQMFREIQYHHKIAEPNLKGIYNKSLIISYFVNQRKKFSQLSW
ncbi:MAG: glycosyltransferase family 2 protein [Chitinophagales bacterium]|nr:glycosyltransferase family 2 protein [Chitinophagales bacterium]MCZ2394706.1 glycosyltransferase family 2 protein [Chitinophagales bacterium]